MTFGTRQYKNGRQRGYLEFASGKRVVLSHDELGEFERKIRDWQYQAVEREQHVKNIQNITYGGAVSGRYRDKEISTGNFGQEP